MIFWKIIKQTYVFLLKYYYTILSVCRTFKTVLDEKSKKTMWKRKIRILYLSKQNVLRAAIFRNCTILLKNQPPQKF